jgi:hypothetical protein
MPPSATRHPYPRPHDNPHRLAPATHRAPVVELLRGKVEITAIETVRKRDFGFSSQLSDYEPPFIKPHVDHKVQRTGVWARCCTTVRRVTRNGANAEGLKIIDNTRALVRPNAPLGVARYVAAESHRKQDDHSVCVWELPGSAAHRECLQCDAPDFILLV